MSTTCPPRFTADAFRPRTSGVSVAVHNAISPIPAEFNLPADVLLPIDPRPSLTIRALKGEVWITQAGHAQDVVLQGGESFTPARQGRIVIQALTDARVALTGILPRR